MTHVKEKPPICKYCKKPATMGKLGKGSGVSAEGTYFRTWRCPTTTCIYYRRVVFENE